MPTQCSSTVIAGKAIKFEGDIVNLDLDARQFRLKCAWVVIPQAGAQRNWQHESMRDFIGSVECALERPSSTGQIGKHPLLIDA
ncbi:hypothetical protein PPS11_17486 [Pseudomonas putida S11]|nr:hypothetical protein PPS11_17486 [Pseudomonas putida S11]